MATAPGVRRLGALSWVRVLAVLVAASVVLAASVLLHHALDATRGTPIRALAGEAGEGRAPPVSSPAFPEVVGPLTRTALRPGHRVELLIDRDVFAGLLGDLERAERSITFFAYYCEPGRLGGEIGKVLAERARAGVAVHFLGDGFACSEVTEALRPGLEAAGAEVAVFRPIRLATLHRAQHRNHARMVVVDGTVGYTGGFGLADTWIGEGTERPWRDTSVRFTGAAVRDLQGAFLAAWAEATGTLLTGSVYLPADAVPNGRADPDRPAGAGALPVVSDAGLVAGLLHSAPGVGTTPAQHFLALTVAGARRTLYVTNSYFVPTPLLRDLLLDAARRGVDVRLLLPGPRTDVPSTRWAGRGFYDEFLSAGIRIYEYRETMMHAKTVVADGVWSAVGSVNWDNRSIRLNAEASLLVHDAGFGATLDSLFLADLPRADEITVDAHRRRPVWQRWLEGLNRLVAPLL